jgi:hypothetical protein
MVPISVWVRANGEWSLLHRCERCGFIRANRIAGDDSEATLLALAAQPLARLPFPLEVLLGLAPSGGPGGPGGSGGPGGPGGPGGCTGVRGTSSTSNTSSQATTNESRKPR